MTAHDEAEAAAREGIRARDLAWCNWAQDNGRVVSLVNGNFYSFVSGWADYTDRADTTERFDRDAYLAGRRAARAYRKVAQS